MKQILTLITLLLIGSQTHSQDLELVVQVFPTSIIGDPIMFNVAVRNTGEDTANGVEVQVNMESGLKFSSFTPNTLDFDPETGVWNVGELEYARSRVLTVIANYATKDNAILSAEVTACSGIDPDSRPGNGVDTNGNGKIIHDKGDEDDGDAAQNGPFN